MQYYNPMAKSGNVYATGQDPNAPPASTPPNLGDQSNLSTYKYLTQVPQWSTGQSFITKSREAAQNALQSGQSTANPEDYKNMDALRSYYANQLSDLPGNTANNISSFDTQSQRGLSNLLSQYKNSQAGTGRLGSRQYAGAQGDIYSKAASDYSTGLINARNQALGQANQIQTGMSGVQNQDLQERQFQANQAKSLSDLINGYMQADYGREGQLSSQQMQKDQQNKQMLGSAAGSAATLGALALMSDARVKTKIRKPTSKEVLKPFRKTAVSAWHYKEEAKLGRGEHIAPMAQALKENGFSEAVEEMPDGTFAVNYARIVGRMFSAISELTKEVDQLRGELRAGKKGAA